MDSVVTCSNLPILKAISIPPIHSHHNHSYPPSTTYFPQMNVNNNVLTSVKSLCWLFGIWKDHVNVMKKATAKLTDSVWRLRKHSFSLAPICLDISLIKRGIISSELRVSNVTHIQTRTALLSCTGQMRCQETGCFIVLICLVWSLNGQCLTPTLIWKDRP